MEQLLNRQSVQMAHCCFSKQEEAPISGEYVLPEYCPDIAVILKCVAYPRLQNRQWSGEQWIVDGTAVIHVLYSDEQRKCVRSVEFAEPFTCSLRGEASLDDTAVEITLSTKYLTCRAVGPRRIEARGAILVTAAAETASACELAASNGSDGLYTRTETVSFSVPSRMYEKILTVSESMEFDSRLPAAEMLLGGECAAVVTECKLLSGKAIVKGNVSVHQLYADSTENAQTHCLDFVIPFSQIMDVADASEGLPFQASVQVLSDTERCAVGPDGENTMLDVSAKLLLQLQIYTREQTTLLNDAFHCRFPIEPKFQDIECKEFLAQRYEETTVSLRISMPATRWQEIVDLWVQPQEPYCRTNNGRCTFGGRMQIGIVGRDADGELAYHECVEEFSEECACRGNCVSIRPRVIGVQYRVNEDSMLLTIHLHLAISDSNVYTKRVIYDLHLCSDAPYVVPKANALLYYGEAGEEIWSIAQRCHTSPSRILEENELYTERLTEPSILVIPVA